MKQSAAFIGFSNAGQPGNAVIDQYFLGIDDIVGFSVTNDDYIGGYRVIAAKHRRQCGVSFCCFIQRNQMSILLIPGDFQTVSSGNLMDIPLAWPQVIEFEKGRSYK